MVFPAGISFGWALEQLEVPEYVVDREKMERGGFGSFLLLCVCGSFSFFVFFCILCFWYREYICNSDV